MKLELIKVNLPVTESAEKSIKQIKSDVITRNKKPETFLSSIRNPEIYVDGNYHLHSPINSLAKDDLSRILYILYSKNEFFTVDFVLVTLLWLCHETHAVS